MFVYYRVIKQNITRCLDLFPKQECRLLIPWKWVKYSSATFCYLVLTLQQWRESTEFLLTSKFDVNYSGYLRPMKNVGSQVIYCLIFIILKNFLIIGNVPQVVCATISRSGSSISKF